MQNWTADMNDIDWGRNYVSTGTTRIYYKEDRKEVRKEFTMEKENKGAERAWD